MEKADLPIGVFDSGLGGLTVLKALVEAFPFESFIYLGDTARIPYGSKSPTTIAKYTERNINYLANRNVKAVVVACNSASGILHMLDPILPVYNVIDPGSLRAAGASEMKRIGVMATRATVTQNSYVRAIERISPDIKVFQQACPLLVPLVEEGWDDDPITNLVVYRYVSPLLAVGIDTLILGCTHYPILRKAIEKVTGPNIQLIQSSEALIQMMNRDLDEARILRTTRKAPGGLQILATDVNDNFQTLAARFMSPIQIRPVEVVDV